MLLNTITILHPIAASSAVNIITQRVASSWPWYIIRASGFIAAGILILLMLSGIGQVTGLTYRFVEPITAWSIHKALAFALCISIAIHAGTLLLDHYLPFSLTQILIPFVSKYNNGTKLLGVPLGSLAVALGILAMYGIIIIVLSSLGWINSKRGTWKKLHLLSYAVAFFVFLHALYIGTDLKYGTFRTAWIILGFIVLLGVISRLWRAWTTKEITT